METSRDPVGIHNDVEITLKNDNFFETFVVCDPKRYKKSRRRRRKEEKIEATYFFPWRTSLSRGLLGLGFRNWKSSVLIGLYRDGFGSCQTLDGRFLTRVFGRNYHSDLHIDRTLLMTHAHTLREKGNSFCLLL